MNSEPLARSVSFDATHFTIDLADGRRLAAPIAWFPRLAHASPEQLERWRLIADGVGVHWPDVDEDISVAGLLDERDLRARFEP